MKVQIIGLGYIGLPTAVLLAENNIEVHGVDINSAKVNNLNKGISHISEIGVGEALVKGLKNGLLSFSESVEECDVHLIVVPTPFKGDMLPDISYVEAAILSLLKVLKIGDLIIIESTSPLCTTEKMANLIFENRKDLQNNIYISYCPERVLPGAIFHELINNDRVIGGINPASSDRAYDFYKTFVKGELHKTNSKTAEMCKLVENSSRDVQIAFANELSIICDKSGINVWNLIDLANKHPRVNILQPGSGVGGHCIAVDPWFIVSDFPEQAHLIKRARETNDYKADWCANRVIEVCQEFTIKTNREPVVACFGLAFKPDIDDLRESPAKYITSRIITEAKAEVLIVEPNVENHKSFELTNYQEAFKKADIIVWLVRHKEFLSIPVTINKIEIDFCGVRK